MFWNNRHLTFIYLRVCFFSVRENPLSKEMIDSLLQYLSRKGIVSNSHVVKRRFRNQTSLQSLSIDYGILSLTLNQHNGFRGAYRPPMERLLLITAHERDTLLPMSRTDNKDVRCFESNENWEFKQPINN